jgi:hypothetical protein
VPPEGVGAIGLPSVPPLGVVGRGLPNVPPLDGAGVGIGLDMSFISMLLTGRCLARA